MTIGELLKKTFDSFTLYTGVKVRLYTDVRDIPKEARVPAGVIENQYGSWYDLRSDSIHVLFPGVERMDEQRAAQRLSGDAIDQLLAAKGLDGLFRESAKPIYRERLVEFVRTIQGQPFSFLLSETDDRRKEWQLNDLLQGDAVATEALSAFLGRMLRLEQPANMAVRVRNGIGRHHRYVVREREKSGDVKEIGKDVALYLQSSSAQSNVVVLGPVSEAYLRLGYPEELKLSANTGQLKDFMKKYGMAIDGEEDNITSLLTDPLAIMENNKPGKNGGAYSYIVVTGKEVNGGRLCFFMNPPTEMIRTLLSDAKKNLLFAAPAILSDQVLVGKMYEEGKVKYLQEIQKPYGREFAYLDEATKKIGAVASPGLTSGSNARLLKTIANLQINFRNPISSEEYFRLFQKKRNPLEDAIAEKGEIARLIAKTEKELKPEQEEPRTLSTSDKLAQLLPTGAFSVNIKDKFAKAGVRTFGDAMQMGWTALRELVGLRAAKLVESAFQEKGLSLITSSSILSEEGFQTLNDAAKSKVILRDYAAALSELDPDLVGKAVKMPFALSGNYYTGEAALHLALRLSAKDAPWKGCPVFATSSELAEFGVKPNETANPIHLRTEGRPVTVYNLEDSDFRKKYPRAYKNYMEGVKGGRTAELPLRIKILLGKCVELPMGIRESYYKRMSESLEDELKGSLAQKAPSVMESLLYTAEGSSVFLSDEEKATIAEGNLQKLERKFAEAPFLVQNFNGRLYTGPAQQMLKADAADRHLLPFYLTKEQAAAAGLQVKGSGTEYFVTRPQGENVKLSKAIAYNIEDTDFPQKYPEHYSIIKSFYEGAVQETDKETAKDSVKATISEIDKLFESPKNCLENSLYASETMRRLIISKGLLGKTLTFREMVDMAEDIINNAQSSEQDIENEKERGKD